MNWRNNPILLPTWLRVWDIILYRLVAYENKPFKKVGATMMKWLIFFGLSHGSSLYNGLEMNLIHERL